MASILRDANGMQVFCPNEYRVCGTLAFISIPSAGSIIEAIVDVDNLDRIISHSRWQVMNAKNTTYAFGRAPRTGKPRPAIALHRFITNAPKGMDVDHINRNGLDCRACNLRIVTRWQNQQNRKAQPNTRSGIKNVNWHEASQGWEIRIVSQGVLYYGGWFKDLEQAALAASTFRQKIHSHCPENSPEVPCVNL